MAEQVSSESLVTCEPIVGRPGMDIDMDMFPWPMASSPAGDVGVAGDLLTCRPRRAPRGRAETCYHQLE